MTKKEEKLNKLLLLINSYDQESIEMGLALLDQKDFKEELSFILMLYKHAKISGHTWRDHAPNIYKEFERLGIAGNNLSFKKALQILLKEKVDKESVEFFMIYFQKHLEEEFKTHGYDFVEDVEIKITLKDARTARELIESE